MAQPLVKQPADDAQEDAFDVLWSRGDVNLIKEPDVYRSVAGGAIFAHPPQELARAVGRMCLELDTLDFTAAMARLEEITRTLHVETAAMLILQSVFSGNVKAHVKKLRPDVERWSMEEVEVTLLSDFMGESVEAIRQRLSDGGDIYRSQWAKIVPDELAVTEEQVHEFYSSLPFPCGLLMAGDSHLGLALRAAPALVGSMIGAKKGFDLGGNCGFVTAAMCAAGLEDVVLIEPNSQVLDFAKYRDDIAGLSGVEYVNGIDHDALRKEREGAYDIGVCTEVLEHLYDVEQAVETVATMIRPGGAAMISASFLMVTTSHLPKNRVYGGQEDALMAKYGLQRVEVTLGFPMLDNMRFYKRV